MEEWNEGGEFRCPGNPCAARRSPSSFSTEIPCRARSDGASCYGYHITIPSLICLPLFVSSRSVHNRSRLAHPLAHHARHGWRHRRQTCIVSFASFALGCFLLRSLTMVQSTLVASGFFQLCNPLHVESPRCSDPPASTFHYQYDTSIQCVDNSGRSAKLRFFCSPGAVPIPNSTVSFVEAKAYLQSGRQAVLLEGIREARLPGNPDADDYQANAPDLPYTLIHGLGIVEDVSANIGENKEIRVLVQPWVRDDNQPCSVMYVLPTRHFTCSNVCLNVSFLATRPAGEMFLSLMSNRASTSSVSVRASATMASSKSPSTIFNSTLVSNHTCRLRNPPRSLLASDKSLTRLPSRRTYVIFPLNVHFTSSQTSLTYGRQLCASGSVAGRGVGFFILCCA